MKRYIKAADGDYIKIGNRILPKNAIDQGYNDYDTVSRNAQRAYDNEQAEKRKAEEARKQEEEARIREENAKEKIATFEKLYAEYAEDDDLNKLMSALFNEFVPPSGPTDNLASEFIRAIERIRYRSHNDGDKFYSGYGLETAAPDAAFLADKAGNNIASEIEDIAEHEVYWNGYDDALDKLAADIVEYIYDNLNLFAEPTEDSRVYDSDYIETWKENSHSLEYEPDTSGDYLDQLIDHDCIDWDDVYQFVDDIANDIGGEVERWAADAYIVRGLDEDEWNEWNNHWDDWWLQWLEEQMQEHEAELNDEDEDEDEYYEDEEYDEDEE